MFLNYSGKVVYAKIQAKIQAKILFVCIVDRRDSDPFPGWDFQEGAGLVRTKSSELDLSALDWSALVELVCLYYSGLTS